MTKQELIKRLSILVVDDAKWSRLLDYIEFIEDETIECLKTSRDIRSINMIQGKLELITQLKDLPEQIRKL